MKLGAEKKKVVLLGVLTIIASYSIYTQLLSNPTSKPRANRRISSVEQRRADSHLHTATRGHTSHPNSRVVKERLDPINIDPTLQTELLTKVRAVTFKGVRRDLFRFSERGRSNGALPAAIEIKAARNRLEATTSQSKLTKPRESVDSRLVTPSIKWKYYGFANSSSDPRRRAFLIGDENQIFIATEGDIFKKRYRVVSIGANSIVIEDLKCKNEQSLPLERG